MILPTYLQQRVNNREVFFLYTKLKTISSQIQLVSVTKKEGNKVPEVRPKEIELSETTENYLKRIFWVTGEQGTAKVSEIANLMGRSLSSTTEAMKRLKEQGFINYKKYGQITLTENGMEVATRINYRYQTIGSFLELLGISKIIAHEDACSMEHAISAHTVKTIEAFIKFIQNDAINMAVLRKFKEQNKT